MTLDPRLGSPAREGQADSWILRAITRVAEARHERIHGPGAGQHLPLPGAIAGAGAHVRAGIGAEFNGSSSSRPPIREQVTAVWIVFGAHSLYALLW